MNIPIVGDTWESIQQLGRVGGNSRVLTVTKQKSLYPVLHVTAHMDGLSDCENEYRRVHTKHGDPPDGVAYNNRLLSSAVDA